MGAIATVGDGVIRFLKRVKRFIFEYPFLSLLMIPGLIFLFFLIIFLFPGLAQYFGSNRYQQPDRSYPTLQPDVIHLSQGWEEEYRRRYYFTPQGSHIIPMDIALALEGAGSSEPIFEPGGGLAVERFGYIGYPSTRNQDGPDVNPLGLPLGFTMDGYVEDTFDGGHKNQTMMLGMTCAACHSSDLTIGGRTIRIDGNQGHGDFMGFFTALDDALVETLNDDAKYRRFERRHAQIIENNPDMLKSDAPLDVRLQAAVTERQNWQARNTPDVKGGHGRVDAFGVIFNQVVGRDMHMDTQPPSGNVRTPNAPVSYPVLWDTPFMGRVQWNGIGNNVREGGVLGRNVGQVLGVFGKSEITRESLAPGYCSTVKRRNLNALDHWIRALNSPQWTDPALDGLLPELDATLMSQGQSIYQRECSSCHAVVEPSYRSVDPDDKGTCDVAITMIDADNAGTDRATVNTGLRTGAYANEMAGLKSLSVDGKHIDPVEPYAFMLTEAVTRAVAGTFRTLTCDGSTDPADLIEATAAFGMVFRSKLGQDVTTRTSAFDYPGAAEDGMTGGRDKASECSAEKVRYLVNGVETKTYSPNSYKARPLNGIWASAPYLHNGSVPTLADLLETPDNRPATFHVGSTDYDPVRVGYVSTPAPNTFLYDTSVEGNRNVGHTHGTDLSATEKAALLEYLKSL